MPFNLSPFEPNPRPNPEGVPLPGRITLERLRSFRLWIIEFIRWRSGGGGTIPDDKCCHLARLDKECNWIVSKSSYSCPEGYYKHWWYCCEGTQQIGCGECTTNPNHCWPPATYECSIFWQTGQSC